MADPTPAGTVSPAAREPPAALDPSPSEPSVPNRPGTEASPAPNQRLLERVAVRLAVLDHERKQPLGETRDLTLGGLFLRTRAPFQVGDTFAIALALPGDPREVVAESEVVRVEPDGVALRFVGVGDADHRRLRRALVLLNNAAGSLKTAELLHASSHTSRTEVSGPAELRALLAQMRESGVSLRLIPAGRPDLADTGILGVEGDVVRLSIKGVVPLEPGEEVYGLCTLKYVSYSFRARVIEVGEGRVAVRIPDRIVHAERRSASRAPIQDAWLVLPLPWSPGHTARWPILDQSDGGLAFRADPAAWTLLPGASLEGARLVAGADDQPLTDAIVRNVRRFDGDDGSWLRVGVSHGVRRRPIDVRRATVADSRSLVGRLLSSARLALTWLELQWRGRRAPPPGSEAARQDEPQVVKLTSRSGRPITGLLQQSYPAEGRTPGPVVLVLPGFGGRKEQMSYLASVLVETFRSRHADLAVLRIDGTNNLGESAKDEGCEGDGRHALHYTVGGVVDDARGALDWLRNNDHVEPTEVIVVSVSFASCGVMKWLADDAPPEVKLWVSYMGAADARDGVRNVSGHYDVFSAAELGQRLGTVTLIGCLVDAQVFWDDLVRIGTGTLAHSRRHLAAIKSDVVWVSGRHDAFMDAERVKDILSVDAPGRRRLLEVDSGHVPRTGTEAIRQFTLVASEVWRAVHGTSIEGTAPSLATLEQRSRREWKRIRRGGLANPAAFWRDYLLGEGGYDVMRWLPAYQQLVEEQVTQLGATGASVLDVGGGTGNLSAALLDAGAAEVVCVDLVPEALDVARAKAGDRPLTTVMANLDGSPRTALRRWAKGSIPRVQDLARRIPELPADVARRLDACADDALYAVLRGSCAEPELLPATAQLLDGDFDYVHDLCALSRAATDLEPGPEGLRRLPTDALGRTGGLPFPDGRYDGAVASLLLSYLDHPEDLLAELHRVIRPGGRLVLSSMRRDADTSGLFLSLVELLEQAPPSRFADEAERAALLDAARAFHGQGATLFRLEEEGLFKFYDAGELAALALAAGFEDPRVSYAFGDPPQAVVVSCRRR